MFLWGRFSRSLLNRCKHLISGLLFQKHRGVLETVLNVFDGAFWGKDKKFHITLEKSNIFKISAKKANLFIIKGKNFCRTISQNISEYWDYKNFYIKTTRPRKIKQLINFIRKIFRKPVFTFSSILNWIKQINM